MHVVGFFLVVIKVARLLMLSDIQLLINGTVIKYHGLALLLPVEIPITWGGAIQ